MTPSDLPDYLLGYRSNPLWRDMSNYLVHFTGSEQAFASILSGGFIRASGPFGWGRKVDEVSDAHKSACLSEVPLDMVDRLAERHGRWGIGFRRELVIASGGARVWYVDEGTPVAKVLFERVGELLRQQNFHDSLWKLTPFIDWVTSAYRYRFEWEREWRVPGGLSFEISDVAFVIVPDGAKDDLVEDLSIGGATYYSDDDLAASFMANPQALATAMEDMADQFRKAFDDPANHLPYDSAEGGYIWLLNEWSTEDAVDWLFAPIEVSVRQSLVNYLNGISGYWVSLAEVKGDLS